MDRAELVKKLEELSSKTKKRDELKNSIHRLEDQEKSISRSTANSRYIKKLDTDHANYYVRKAYEQADKKAMVIKVAVWLAAILLILCVSVNLIQSLVYAERMEVLAIVALSSIALGCLISHILGSIITGDGWMPIVLTYFCVIFGPIFAVVLCVAGFEESDLNILGKPMVFPGSDRIFIAYFVVLVVAISLAFFFTFSKVWQKSINDKEFNKIANSEEYKKAVAQDHANIDINKARQAAADKEYHAEIQTRLESVHTRMQQYRQTLSELEKELQNNSIMPYADISKIESVLYKIKNMRADSVKEALLQCDADDRELARVRWQGEMEIQRQRQAAQNDLERYWAQQKHNYEVEKQQRRAADELERIRKELEN